MDIELNVQPADGVKPPPNASSTAIEATYLRKVPEVEGQPNEPVVQAVRFPLDPNLKGTTTLKDAADAQVTANVLTVDGALLFARGLTADSFGVATLTLTKDEVDKIANPSQAVPGDTVPLVSTRTVQLVPTQLHYERRWCIRHEPGRY